MGLRYGWKRDHHNNLLEVQVAGETVAYFPGRGSDFVGQGDAFYVDTSGNDNHNGLSPSTPVLTIDAALALCTDDEHDYIFVMDCYNDDTFPITVDKSTVHIIGVSNPTPWAWATLNGGGTDVMRLSSNYAEIAGFSLVSASADGIHFYANIGYCWLHHLNFAVAATSVVNGIEFDSTYGTNSLVEHCTFGATSSHVTGWGIYGGSHQCEIRNNNFMACASGGISMTGGNTAKIHDNYFALADDANGEAISLASGVTGTLVVNNIATNGMLSNAYSYNPYRDLASNTSNHWALNYRGNAVVEPVGI